MSVTFGAVDRIEENTIEADFWNYTAEICVLFAATRC